MTSKNKTSQPDNTPAAEDTSSDQKTLDASAVEAAAADGEKTDELEEVTDPIAADMAAADEDYIMEIEKFDILYKVLVAKLILKELEK